MGCSICVKCMKTPFLPIPEYFYQKILFVFPPKRTNAAGVINKNTRVFPAFKLVQLNTILSAINVYKKFFTGKRSPINIKLYYKCSGRSAVCLKGHATANFYSFRIEITIIVE